MRKYIFSFLLIITPINAAEFTVSDQDQASIAQMCELAAKSSSVTIEMTSAISQWCLQWKQRMQQVVPKDKPKEKSDAK